MSFTPNEDGIERMFAEVSAKIAQVDRDLRERYTGRPAEDIIDPAAQAFAEIGVNITGDLTDYARSIERNEEFRLDTR